MHKILQKLKGGDRRSIGRADEVVADTCRDPTLFEAVFGGMLCDDPLIRMRAADAIEKITAKHPEYLQPYKKTLLQKVATIDQQEVRWHVAQMLPRLNLDGQENEVLVAILMGYLRDQSKIVKTCSMQALADLAEQDTHLCPKVINILEDLTKTGSPAMKNRGKKLLAKLKLILHQPDDRLATQ